MSALPDAKAMYTLLPVDRAFVRLMLDLMLCRDPPLPALECRDPPLCSCDHTARYTLLRLPLSGGDLYGARPRCRIYRGAEWALARYACCWGMLERATTGVPAATCTCFNR